MFNGCGFVKMLGEVGVVFFRFMFLYFFFDNMGFLICCEGFLVMLRFVWFVGLVCFLGLECFLGCLFCGRVVSGFLDLKVDWLDLGIIVGVLFLEGVCIFGGSDGGGFDVFCI